VTHTSEKAVSHESFDVVRGGMYCPDALR
jgi:hypothetical protein